MIEPKEIIFFDISQSGRARGSKQHSALHKLTTGLLVQLLDHLADIYRH